MSDAATPSSSQGGLGIGSPAPSCKVGGTSVAAAAPPLPTTAVAAPPIRAAAAPATAPPTRTATANAPPPPPAAPFFPTVSVVDAPPCTQVQEEDFQLSLYHYCLWKNFQNQNKKKPPPTAESRQTPDTNNGNNTNAADKDQKKHVNWYRIVSTLEEEIPHLAEFKGSGLGFGLEQTTPPVLQKLSGEHPTVLQQVAWLRQRVICLEAYAANVYANNSNNMNATTMAALSATTTMTPQERQQQLQRQQQQQQQRKRKAALENIDWSAFEMHQEKKKKRSKKSKQPETTPQSSAEKKTSMLHSSITTKSILPKGAPKELVELITELREDARKDRKRANKKIKSLEAKVKAKEEEDREKMQAQERAVQEAKEKVETEKRAAAQAAAAAAEAAAKLRRIPFDTRMQQLEHFRQGNGHCNVSTRWTDDTDDETNNGLGKWVANIRRYWRQCQEDPRKLYTEPIPAHCPNHYLSAERIARLDAMNFRWVYSTKARTPWSERLEQMKAFKAKNGHMNIKRTDETLGEFIHLVRANYRAGKLKPEQIRELEALGFLWSARKQYPTWDERVDECREYRRKNGNLDIPLPNQRSSKGVGQDGENEQGSSNDKSEQEACAGTTGSAGENQDGGDEENGVHEKEQSLCKWAHGIRREFTKFQKGLQCRLNETKIKQLENLGFDWKMPQVDRSKMDRSKRDGTAWRPRFNEEHTQNFDARIEILRKINEQYGDCNNPAHRKKYFGDDQESNQKLYHFIRTQRKHYTALQAGTWNSLSEERLKKLRDVGFDFAPRAHWSKPGTKKKKNGASSWSTGHRKRGNDESDDDDDEDDTEDEQDGYEEVAASASVRYSLGEQRHHHAPANVAALPYQQNYHQQQQSPQYHQQRGWEKYR